MSWSTYVAFVVFAVVLILVPGPDFAVVTKNTLAGGCSVAVGSAVPSTPRPVSPSSVSG